MNAHYGPCKELYYLVTIAEEGSLTKATEKLYVAQPSLSFFLKEFENKVGSKIFMRVKSGLVPTAVGEILILTARKMLDDWESALSVIKEIPSAMPYVFATPAFRGTIILPSIIVDLQTALPDLNFKFEEILTKNAPAAFETGRIDAAFMVDKKMNGEEYVNRKIFDEEIFLVSSPISRLYSDAHVNANGLWIEPTVLKEYNIIVLQHGHQLSAKVDEFLSENNITPKKIINTSNIVTSMKMAESGIGITFLPSMFLSQCSCVPVSVGQEGLHWPIFLSTKAATPNNVNDILYSSIQSICEYILLKNKKNMFWPQNELLPKNQST